MCIFYYICIYIYNTLIYCYNIVQYYNILYSISVITVWLIFCLLLKSFVLSSFKKVTFYFMIMLWILRQEKHYIHRMNPVFLTQQWLFIYILSIVAFAQEQQSWEVETAYMTLYGKMFVVLWARSRIRILSALKRLSCPLSPSYNNLLNHFSWVLTS